jgi:hypothetical protein
MGDEDGDRALHGGGPGGIRVLGEEGVFGRSIETGGRLVEDAQ